MYKNKRIGKLQILEEPFSVKGRNYCKVKCNWCGRVFETQLRQVKKGKGCQCTFNSFDFLGKKFGKLTIIEIIDNKNFKCLCDCGNVKILNKYNVLTGNSKNCGCEHYKTLLEKNLKHGKSQTRIYSLYNSMKNRCFNKKLYAYKWYGKKGIKICDKWLGKDGFVNFYNWALNNGYNDNFSIERIDINNDYCPENCKWIPLQEQRLNTSQTIRIESNQGIKTVKELSEEFKIPKSTLYSRIKKLGKNNIKQEELI